jgi:type I restriction enzyme S subunit
VKAGWEVRSIASFAKTGAGGTPKKSTKAFYEGGSIPWLLSGEVANANIVEAKNFITARGLKGSSTKLFPANSVLVAMYGATAGEVGVLRFEASTNQAVCAVLPSDHHVPEYLYYYLLHAKPSLVAQAVGKLRLINGEQFVELVFEHYTSLSRRYRAMIPLKQIFVPDLQPD